LMLVSTMSDVLRHSASASPIARWPSASIANNCSSTGGGGGGRFSLPLPY
jgi:hypothetical protein